METCELDYIFGIRMNYL